MELTTTLPKALRSQLKQDAFTAQVRGTLPSWLRGRLMRTAPAMFSVGGWNANHWFDGLGMIYSFVLEGEVSFRQQALNSETSERITAGKFDNPQFGTRMRRGFWNRLTHPVPRENDNTNVNIVRMGEEWVAMTETNVQHVIDPITLRSQRRVQYQDDLGNTLFMLAHPHFDHDRNAVVNVGSDLSSRSRLVVYSHGAKERSRRVLASLKMHELPYQHSFGLTPSNVVLVGGPYVMKPWTLLWSDGGLTDHFRWKPQNGSWIAVIDRATGAIRRHTAEAMFVFHTINTFERQDGTIVHDVVASSDAELVKALSIPSLLQGLPDLRGQPTRLILRPGQEKAEVQILTEQKFEFPSISYRACSGRDYSVVWGASNHPVADDSYRSDVVRVDLATGTTRSFSESGYIFGEPIFVREPGSADPNAGVLLCVGSHGETDRSCLAVLDATSLEPRAMCEVDVPIPLGFHGSFSSRLA